MNLDELERLAERALPLPFDKGPEDVPFEWKRDFKNAMSPDTALKLIKVARAADALSCSLKNPNLTLSHEAEEHHEMLQEALKELES